MFESAISDGGPGRGALSFSGSLLLQCGVAGALLCAGLLMPVALPDVPELHIAPPTPRFRDAIKIISTSIERTLAPAPSPQRILYVPQRIESLNASQTISRSIEAMSDGLPLVGGGPGVPDGVIGVGQIPTVAAPPPQAKPVVRNDPQPTVPTRMGGDVMASKLIHRVQPQYPALARQARIQGVVQLHGIITKEGRIGQLRVISGHPLLVKAALDAVQQWIYSPTYLNKQPVEVEAPIDVRFILGQ